MHERARVSSELPLLPLSRDSDEHHGRNRNLNLDLEPHASSSPTSASPTTPQAAKNASTAFLDGLRGLAALCVFFQHCIGGFDENVHDHGFGEGGHWYLASLPFVRIFFNGGNAAVAVFFVLSGYVLSRSPLRLARDGNSRGCLWALASSVVRRPIRLYLPVFAITFTFAILRHAPFHIVGEILWPDLKPDVFVEIKTWIADSYHFFNPFRSHDNQHWFTYGIVVWTIPIELKGSMLIYAAAALHAVTATHLSPGRTTLLCAAIALLLLQTGFWTMACFLAGLALAYLDIHALDAPLKKRLAPRARALLTNTVFILGFYLLTQPAHGGHREYALDTPGWGTLTRLVPAAYDENQYYRYWTSWGSVLVVYAALRVPWLQGVFGTRPLRYLGRVSFMFYLVHLPMQYMLGDRVGRMFGTVPGWAPTESWWDNKLPVPDWGGPGFSLRFFLTMAVMLPVNLVVSDFLTRVLDMPCVRLGKRLSTWLGLERRASGRKIENGG
ncbi:acyltransferase 3 [Staphylotrichum tortipilum]|uniref:Acyltransferase 3 n=1 Tax=Staphylotrichum tortipilum TaxID=2831512 RepID=A0AAN6MKY4_9PEZI|nr:acyltransferase 3 [Staphylotrichum longicolle]